MNALVEMLMSALELRTSELARAPMSLALVEVKLTCPFEETFMSPNRESNWKALVALMPVIVAVPTMDEIDIPTPTSPVEMKTGVPPIHIPEPLVPKFRVASSIAGDAVEADRSVPPWFA
jgi:hypothetical protein